MGKSDAATRASHTAHSLHLPGSDRKAPDHFQRMSLEGGAEDGLPGDGVAALPIGRQGGRRVAASAEAPAERYALADGEV